MAPFGGYDSFEACVRANGDKANPEAYCATIKRRVEGAELSEEEAKHLDEDPCWDGYTMVGFKTEGGEEVPNCVPSDEVEDANLEAAEGERCPEGYERVGDRCVPVEHVPDVPPSMLSEPAPPTRVLQEELNTETIERIEDGETVRYTNIRLLSPGLWTDAGSRETVWYSPDGIRNLEVVEDNTLNVMHDTDNDVSAVGRIDPDSVRTDETGNLYGDLEIDRSNAAGEYADENLRKTLETNGRKGFGGPSVEIAAEGQVLEFNAERGAAELKAGKITGAGLVSEPASKPVSFSRQTAQREVALAAAEGWDRTTPMVLAPASRRMADVSAEEFSEFVASHLEDTSPGDVTDAMEDLGEFGGVELREVASLVATAVDEDTEDVLTALEGMDTEGEEMENADGMYDDEEEDDEEEENEDAEMMDADVADFIQEELDDLWGRIEELEEMLATEEEMEAALSELQAEVADAETVAELRDAKEDLDRRLSEIEEEPEEARTLADDGDAYEPAYDSTISKPDGW